MTAKALEKLGQGAWRVVPVAYLPHRGRREWMEVTPIFAHTHPERVHLTYAGALVR